MNKLETLNKFIEEAYVKVVDANNLLPKLYKAYMDNCHKTPKEIKNIIQNTLLSNIAILDVIKEFSLKNSKAVAVNILNCANDNFDFSYLVHESLCDLFGLVDIERLYEKHKIIAPIYSSQDEWGKGSGKISPHVDDLYEEMPTPLLALMVAKDDIGIPTKFCLPKDIFKVGGDNAIKLRIL